MAASMVKPSQHLSQTYLEMDPWPSLRPRAMSGGQAGRPRSLKNVKDSTENLQRLTRDPRQTTERMSSATGGQHFRVGNIGTDGFIYLRPVNAPIQAHPKSTQLTAPITPPHSAERRRSPSPDLEGRGSVRDSNLSGSGTFRSSLPGESATRPEPSRLPSTPPPETGRAHTRSHSISTANSHRDSGGGREHGTFRIVIDQASPKKTRDSDKPLLETTIPHYRLGAPHFTDRGSAILHSSINTGTSLSGDLHSSAVSQTDYGKLFPAPPGGAIGVSDQRGFSGDQPTTSHYLLERILQRRTLSSELLPRHSASRADGDRLTHQSTSEMSQDDQNILRHSSTNGTIIAATPTQLIAQITSPKLLDYDLLSDFFLTFRAFMKPHDLVTALVERLKWAVSKPCDTGRIVRVRAFVALRHWILNYFPDDFVPRHDLRQYFCDLVNQLHTTLLLREDGGGGDSKIVSELKKCWRRTCALYWDPPHASTSVDDPIYPGGRLGSRSSNIDSDEREPVQLAGTAPAPKLPPIQTNFPWSNFHPQGYRTPSPQDELNRAQEERETIRHSIHSQAEHYSSCSIPITALPRSREKTTPSLGPRPAPPTSAALARRFSPGVISKPKPRSRRSGSFSDALRDDRASSSSPKPTAAEIVTAPPQTAMGSLIRGLYVEPNPPFVEAVAPSSPDNEDSHFHFKTPSDEQLLTEKQSAPAMRKFLGTVRRALSAKYTSAQNHGDGDIDTSSRRSFTGSQSRSSLAPSRTGHGVPKRKLVGGQAKPRVDLLAEKVYQSFQNAKREEGEAETPKAAEPVDDSAKQWHAATQPTLAPPSEQSNQFGANMNSGVTMGSHSIVIVDDTGNNTPSTSRMLGPPTTDLAPSVTSSPRLDGDSRRQTVPITLDPSTPLDDMFSHSRSSLATHRSSLPPLERDGDMHRVSRGPPLTSHPVPRPTSYLLAPDDKHGVSDQHSHGSGFTGMTEELAQQSEHPAEDVVDNNSANADHSPARQLRRVPGGDLRSVDHVHDLEDNNSTHNTMSIASQTKPTQSLAIPVRKSSAKAAALAQLAGTSTNNTKAMSMLPTHSSQPNMRPSFEQQVANLAKIPDDGDDGGIESTLLKLEGRYEKSSNEASPMHELDAVFGSSSGTQVHEETPVAHVQESHVGPSTSQRQSHDRAQEVVSSQDSEAHRGLTSFVEDPDDEATETPKPASHIQFLAGTRTMPHVKTISVADSEASYSSIPLLERGISQRVSKRVKMNNDWREQPLPPPHKDVSLKEMQPQASNPSFVVIEKSESMDQIPPGLTEPTSDAHRSFLLDDDQSLTESEDEKSQPGDHPAGTSEGMRSFYGYDSGVLGDEAVLRNEAGNHEAALHSHPPRGSGIPSSIVEPTRLAMNEPIAQVPVSDRQPGPIAVDHYVTEASKVDQLADSLHPGRNATSFFEDRASPQPNPQTSKEKEAPPQKPKDLPLSQRSQDALTPTSRTVAATHLPFILNFDSLLLAQQLTLIEKDALTEIDWRDLIELRWKQSYPAIHNWVDFLKTDAPRSSYAPTVANMPGAPLAKHRSNRGSGIDIVISRFNLMVKWALSEIVLTEDLTERAATIIKYIHIAQHARRLRNWATMYQITMALVSADCSRLKATWSQVPDEDRKIVKQLEALIMPTGNFKGLRTEMEHAANATISICPKQAPHGASTGESGCIPFIGIYTHDLIYNAQKPAFYSPPSPTGNESAITEPIVNFERHHMAATIVKSLLTLLESSTKYNFTPVPEVLSRCVWMASLEDAEIRSRSRELEA